MERFVQEKPTKIDVDALKQQGHVDQKELRGPFVVDDNIQGSDMTLEYNPIYQMPPYYRELVKDIEKNQEFYKNLPYSKRLFYAMKLRGECDRVYNLTTSMVADIQTTGISQQINRMYKCYKILLHDVNSPARLEDMTDDPNLRRNPWVVMLTKYRDNGDTFDEAVNKLSSYLNVSRQTIKAFSERNKLKYPNFSKSDPDYISGVMFSKYDRPIDISKSVRLPSNISVAFIAGYNTRKR